MARSVELQESLKVEDLLKIVSDATAQAKTKIQNIRDQGDNISIGDMFDMQMFMNRLAQLSEMCTSVVNALNGSIGSMARNVKG